MRFSQGGLRLDPARGLELSTLDREPKRSNASGVGQVHPDSAFPVARIHQTVAQTIFAAWTTVTMDSETFDNDGIGDLANDRIVVKFPGFYALFGCIKWASVATPAAGDSRFARFLVNGASIRESGGWRVADGQQVRVVCSDVVSLSRGGTVALQGFATAAGVLTVMTDGPPALAVAWLGPS